MPEKKYDAIVIGAGPAGASAARTLTAGGMSALLIEKKKLPRHKMCSGILSHWSVDFTQRHFGVIPESAYSGEIPFLRGFSAHFPSVSEPVLLDNRSPVPNIRRKDFDFFLAEKSGAAIKDGLMMEDIKTEKGGYAVSCKRFGKNGRAAKTTLRVKYLVAADGSNSRAVWRMFPEARKGLPMTGGIQIHYRGKIDLDPEYYHVFFYPGLGFYTWASVKDGLIWIGNAGMGENKPARLHEKYLEMLKKNYGLEIQETVFREGMSAHILAPYNKFILGTENFLVAGDAAGFMHQGGEGISCALTSGHLAGQAILEAEKNHGRAHDIYRVIARGEVELCLDQFNPLKMFMKFPFRIDFVSLLKNYTPRGFFLTTRDFRAFMSQDTGVDKKILGRIAKQNMIHHLIRGHYPVEL